MAVSKPFTALSLRSSPVHTEGFRQKRFNDLPCETTHLLEPFSAGLSLREPFSGVPEFPPMAVSSTSSANSRIGPMFRFSLAWKGEKARYTQPHANIHTPLIGIDGFWVMRCGGEGKGERGKGTRERWEEEGAGKEGGGGGELAIS